MDEVSTKAVMEAAHQQKKFLDSADPTTAFIETIQTMMSSGIAHFRTKSGGIPREAERFGWTKTDVAGEMPTWKPQGPRLGWVDLDDDYLLLDPSSLVLVKKWSGGRLPTTPQTLLKRLKDDGLLARTDDARDRNTVRMTLEGHPHNVIVLDLSQFFPEED